MASYSPLYLSGTAFLLLFLFRCYMHYKWGRCTSKRSLEGKTIIVTGANSGLGKVTALELAKRRARVILACRDVDCAQQAIRDIRKATANGELVVKHLDLASMTSVRTFAEDVLRTEAALHVLINNAGVCQCPFRLTEDGYESQFAVNHLGHFLLTNLLLDRLTASMSSRVVVVSSQLYHSGKIDFNNLNGEVVYNRKAAYCNSKLANVLFGRELAKRTKGTSVNVLILSPGFVWTRLGRHVHLRFWQKLALFLFGIAFVRSPLEGCQTILHCAISEETEGKNGTFYRNCKETPFHPVALNNEMAIRLWDVSEQMTGLH